MMVENLKKILTQKQYLGDGLYAQFDHGQIILSTQRENGEHWVGLEPEIFHGLLEYKKWVNEVCSEIRKLQETA